LGNDFGAFCLPDVCRARRFASTSLAAVIEVLYGRAWSRPAGRRSSGGMSLTLKTRFEIEATFDYLCVEGSTDGGTTSRDGAVVGSAG
jgi:hypothetical protein